MRQLLALLIGFIAVLLFALAGWRYGVDSRDGCDWKPLEERPQFETFTRAHSPLDDLANLRHALRRILVSHNRPRSSGRTPAPTES